MSRILLGVTGGIAAYKTPELVRLLIKSGHEVRVVLSESAKAFVSELSLQAVSGQSVGTSLLEAHSDAAMDHIALARWADAILIAPATANRLAALRMGLADDLLTTLCLAATCPIIAAPAMNKQMWMHPATQENITVLKKRGMVMLGPGWGEQACGEIGLGRMIELEEIVAHFHPPKAQVKKTEGILKGLRLILTAGPTREPIDPVRYISNRSSGKMGFALAEAAVQLGAEVVLIAGPVKLDTPAGVERVDVETAQEMLEAVLAAYQQGCDIFMGVAAVADFACETIATQKIKKNTHSAVWEPRFKSNPDILAQISAQESKPFCVGFAAETEQAQLHAKQKLVHKSLDMIALNCINEAHTGFDVDTNALHVFWPAGEAILPLATKKQIAKQLLTLIGQRHDEKNSVKDFG